MAGLKLEQGLRVNGGLFILKLKASIAVIQRLGNGYLCLVAFLRPVPCALVPLPIFAVHSMNY